MTDIEKAREWLQKMRDWLSTFDGMPQGADFYIDYNRNDPSNAGLHSNGLIPVEQMDDNIGNIFLSYQLNFALHVVLPKIPDEDSLSSENAAFILAFQRWVIRQSAQGKTPRYGDIDLEDERTRAQNGALYTLPDDGAALYAVTISVNFKEIIKEDE